VLPALEHASPDAAAQDHLATRLAGLELEAFQAEPEPATWEPWLAAPFRVPAIAESGEGMMSVQPPLSALQVHRDGADWHITLHDGDNTLPVGVGTRGWTVSTPSDTAGHAIPVAAAGGWTDPRTLRLEVIFLETPHRLDILCSLDDRCANAVWRLPPLGGARLGDLRSPV
jgi:hypothetical protein